MNRQDNPLKGRLGRNHGGYCGETIDIGSVLKDVEIAAQQHGWSAHTFLQTAELRLIALRRPPLASGTAQPARDLSESARRIYISAGIHGDEPAGPLAVRRLLQEDRWPPNLDLWLCPCLNPTGFALNRRENARGIDLNRQYRSPAAAEVVAHTRWLQRQPGFDCSFCLHEDWESRGFYVYELNTDNRPSLAGSILRRVAELCPIDPSPTIEDRPAQNGLIRPDIDPRTRPDWPEAFFLVMHKTRRSYTLEAPSDFPLSIRVAALVAGVNAALELLADPGAS
jgi:protein MpaA